MSEDLNLPALDVNSPSPTGGPLNPDGTSSGDEILTTDITQGVKAPVNANFAAVQQQFNALRAEVLGQDTEPLIGYWDTVSNLPQGVGQMHFLNAATETITEGENLSLITRIELWNAARLTASALGNEVDLSNRLPSIHVGGLVLLQQSDQTDKKTFARITGVSFPNENVTAITITALRFNGAFRNGFYLLSIQPNRVFSSRTDIRDWPLPVADGGTGAESAGTAWTNLGIPNRADVEDIVRGTERDQWVNPRDLEDVYGILFDQAEEDYTNWEAGNLAAPDGIPTFIPIDNIDPPPTNAAIYRTSAPTGVPSTDFGGGVEFDASIEGSNRRVLIAYYTVPGGTRVFSFVNSAWVEWVDWYNAGADAGNAVDLVINSWQECPIQNHEGPRLLAPRLSRSPGHILSWATDAEMWIVTRSSERNIAIFRPFFNGSLQGDARFNLSLAQREYLGALSPDPNSSLSFGNYQMTLEGIVPAGQIRRVSNGHYRITYRTEQRQSAPHYLVAGTGVELLKDANNYAEGLIAAALPDGLTGVQIIMVNFIEVGTLADGDTVSLRTLGAHFGFNEIRQVPSDSAQRSWVRAVNEATLAAYISANTDVAGRGSVTKVGYLFRTTGGSLSEGEVAFANNTLRIYPRGADRETLRTHLQRFCLIRIIDEIGGAVDIITLQVTSTTGNLAGLGEFSAVTDAAHTELIGAIPSDNTSVDVEIFGSRISREFISDALPAANLASTHVAASQVALAAANRSQGGIYRRLLVKQTPTSPRGAWFNILGVNITPIAVNNPIRIRGRISGSPNASNDHATCAVRIRDNPSGAFGALNTSDDFTVFGSLYSPETAWIDWTPKTIAFDFIYLPTVLTVHRVQLGMLFYLQNNQTPSGDVTFALNQLAITTSRDLPNSGGFETHLEVTQEMPAGVVTLQTATTRDTA